LIGEGATTDFTDDSQEVYRAAPPFEGQSSCVCGQQLLFRAIDRCTLPQVVA
jgi:hypothetical protein